MKNNLKKMTILLIVLLLIACGICLIETISSIKTIATQMNEINKLQDELTIKQIEIEDLKETIHRNKKF